MGCSFCGCCCNEKANGGNVAIIRAFTALSASLPARNDAGTPMQPAFSPDEGEGIVHGRPLIVIPTIGERENGTGTGSFPLDCGGRFG